MEQDAAKATLAQELGVIETPQQQFEATMNTTFLLAENAIPIPPTIGARFEHEYQRSLSIYKEFHTDWNECIQQFFKTGSLQNTLNGAFPEENFARAIISSLNEMTYMQNPAPEFSNTRDEDKNFSDMLNTLLTTLVTKKAFPGINLRPHVQRLILMGHMTNYGVMKINYQEPKGSLQDAVDLYQKTQAAIKEQKDPAKAAPMYALLDRLYAEISTRKISGVSVNNVSPFLFFTDADATKDDLSDCRLTFEIDYIPEEQIKSEYLYINADEQYFYKYRTDRPYNGGTLVNNGDNAKASAQDAIYNMAFSEYTENEKIARKQDKLPCIWVYDRATRLKYLYIQDQWDCPLWVFEDELKLSRFFPYFLLTMSPSVTGLLRFSEASYYIPFQKEINKDQQLLSKIKSRAGNTIIYNSNEVDGAELKRVFEEAEKQTGSMKLIGVKLKLGDKSLEDVAKPFVYPVTQMMELFNNDKLRQAIGNISRLSDVFRGQQLKTNTTNDAVAMYQDVAQNKLSTLTDLIEETIGALYWAITEIIVSKYPKEIVDPLLTKEQAAEFKQMSVEELNIRFNLRVEAGSSEKPTSMNKKKEAINTIQLLGQFGAKAPMTVLTVVFKLLRNVFSKNIVTDNELKQLEQESLVMMQGQMQQPQMQQPAQQQQPPVV